MFSNDPRVSSLDKYESRIGSDISVSKYTTPTYTKNTNSVDDTWLSWLYLDKSLASDSYNFNNYTDNFNYISIPVEDGLIVAVRTDINTNFGIMIIKIDNNGKKILEFIVNIPNSIIDTTQFSISGVFSNGLLYLSGTYLKSGLSQIPYSFLLKIDISLQSIIWQKSFSNVYMSREMTIDSNDNIYTIVRTSDIDYVVKFDSDGNQIFRKSYKVTFSSPSNSSIRPIEGLKKSSDDSIVFSFLTFEYSQTTNSYYYRRYVFKIDGSGSIIWSKRVYNSEFGPYFYENDTVLHVDSNDNIYYQYMTNYDQAQTVIKKIDSNGNHIFSNTLSWGSEYPGNIKYKTNLSTDSDNNLYASLAAYKTLYILKFDQNGNQLFRKNFDSIITAIVGPYEQGKVSIYEKTLFLVWFRTATITPGGRHVLSVQRILDGGESDTAYDMPILIDSQTQETETISFITLSPLPMTTLAGNISNVSPSVSSISEFSNYPPNITILDASEVKYATKGTSGAIYYG